MHTVYFLGNNRAVVDIQHDTNLVSSEVGEDVPALLGKRVDDVVLPGLPGNNLDVDQTRQAGRLQTLQRFQLACHLIVVAIYCELEF